MTKADDYRRRAQEAEDLAKIARSLEARHAFEEVARQWRKLAEKIEGDHRQAAPLGGPHQGESPSD